jgi:hypothetical protein
MIYYRNRENLYNKFSLGYSARNIVVAVNQGFGVG